MMPQSSTLTTMPEVEVSIYTTNQQKYLLNFIIRGASFLLLCGLINLVDEILLPQYISSVESDINIHIRH